MASEDYDVQLRPTPWEKPYERSIRVGVAMEPLGHTHLAFTVIGHHGFDYAGQAVQEAGEGRSPFRTIERALTRADTSRAVLYLTKADALKLARDIIKAIGDSTP